MAPSPAEGRPGEPTDQLSPAFLERLKSEPLGEMTVLDAGTGSGRVALALAPLCRAVVGVDRDARAIDEARRSAAAARLSNVRFVVGDIEVEEYAPFKPDLVVAYSACPTRSRSGRAGRCAPPGVRLRRASQRPVEGDRATLALCLRRDRRPPAPQEDRLHVEHLEVEREVKAFASVEEGLAAAIGLQERWKQDGRCFAT